MSGRTTDVTLRVDWPSCRARGLCAELLPEHIGLDEWGYPVVDALLPQEVHAQAERAARACPHRALRLTAARR